jgi:hypothetical protein
MDDDDERHGETYLTRQPDLIRPDQIVLRVEK